MTFDDRLVLNVFEETLRRQLGAGEDAVVVDDELPRAGRTPR
jgi:hypothetical protein